MYDRIPETHEIPCACRNTILATTRSEFSFKTGGGDFIGFCVSPFTPLSSKSFSEYDTCVRGRHGRRLRNISISFRRHYNFEPFVFSYETFQTFSPPTHVQSVQTLFLIFQSKYTTRNASVFVSNPTTRMSVSHLVS